MMQTKLYRSLLRSLHPNNRLVSSPDWLCWSCRSKLQSRKSSTSTKASPDKPYYITTPIFYVNAGRHWSPSYHDMSLTIWLTVAYSPPCRPPLYNGPDGHSEAMANTKGQESYFEHGDR